MERTLSILQRMAGYFHDDVREQAYDSLAYLVAATAKAFPTSAPGIYSLPYGHNVHCVTSSMKNHRLVVGAARYLEYIVSHCALCHNSHL